MLVSGVGPFNLMNSLTFTSLENHTENFYTCFETAPPTKIISNFFSINFYICLKQQNLQTMAYMTLHISCNRIPAEARAAMCSSPPPPGVEEFRVVVSRRRHVGSHPLYCFAKVTALLPRKHVL